jgi:hypothetical protein
MHLEQFPTGRGWIVKVRPVVILALTVGAVAALVIHASGQQQANISYVVGVEGGKDWNTTVRLTNLEEQQIEIALAAYDGHGRSLKHAHERTDLGSKRIESMEAHRIFSALSGSLKVESSSRYTAALVLESLDGNKVEIIPAIRQTSNDLVFPALFAGDDSFKKITELNAGSTAANLDIIALAKDGSELQRTFFPLLPSMGTQTSSLERLFSGQTLEELAVVRITSDKTLVGLQTIDPPEGDLVGLPALTTPRREWSLPVQTSTEMRELWTTIGVFNPGLEFRDA